MDAHFFKDIEHVSFFRLLDRNRGRASTWSFVPDAFALRRDRQQVCQQRAARFVGNAWHPVVILKPFGFRDDAATQASGKLPLIYQLARVPRAQVSRLATFEVVALLNGMSYESLNKTSWRQDGNVLVGKLDDLPRALGICAARAHAPASPDWIGTRLPPVRVPAGVPAIFYRYAAQPSHMAQPAKPDKWLKTPPDGWFDPDPRIPFSGLRVICMPEEELRFMGGKIRLEFLEALAPTYLNTIQKEGEKERFHTHFGLPCAFIAGLPANEQEARIMFANPRLAFNRFKDYCPPRRAAPAPEVIVPPLIQKTDNNGAKSDQDTPYQPRAEEQSSPQGFRGQNAWRKLHDAMTTPVGIRHNPAPLLRMLKRIKDSTAPADVPSP